MHRDHGYSEQLRKEFERQVEILLGKRYPEAAGVSAAEFMKQLRPLEGRLGQFALPEVDFDTGHLPFVIVVKSEWVTVEKAMRLVERKGHHGLTRMYPREPKDFATIDGVAIPSGKVYLLLDIDRGKETINMPPKEALPLIESRKRWPLTIDEGVAILTHYPEFLAKNNCFSLLASRYSGDKRVPAIWINGAKQPHLGWCWNGNPHTWLGSASCGGRV